MDSERKNHKLPSAPTFYTLEQLENSIDAIKRHHSQRVSDKRLDRYGAMKTDAIDREITHLETERRRSVITKGGRRTLNRLNRLKQEQIIV